MPRLLIVEDSDVTAHALRVLFAESGYEVTTAASVASAIASARDARPDVMLLDLSLPDGDGLLVLQNLQATDDVPRATIALTGHDDDALRDQCIAAGCREVLLKPVPVRELLERVRSL